MAKIKKIQESGATIYPATITNAVKDPETGKTIPEILKEREEDTYPKMTVGFAENVVGDGSATEEEFSFRPTAGVNRNTLNDGAARIHTIKGRSIVANQQILAQTTVVTVNGVTFTANAENGTVRATGIPTEAAHLGFKAIKWNDGEKFFVFGGVEGGGPYPYGNMILDQGRQNDQGGGSIWTPQSYWGEAGMAPILRIGTDYIGQEIDFTFKPIIVNLTQMFGAGNEPLTVEEYYQRKPILLNEDEYNEGKLVNLVPQAIKTTGLNQFNGTYAKVLGGVQYYLGGNYTSVGFATEEGGDIEAITTPTSSEVVGGSAPDDRLYTPMQNGYIYANGDSICISLYWPTEYGNLYGTYKPYKPFERDLSWIKTIKDSTGNAIFPNGMRSAGNVADEIRFNSTKQRWEAVQRVGVVDLGELTWTYGFGLFQSIGVNNASGYNVLCPKYSTGDGDKEIRGHSSQNGYIYVKDSSFTDANSFKEAMQRVMLNYELAKPIVTPITENVNLDYDVSDYGTEELIVAEGVESAPLSASIEYSPNVLAMLKNAPDIADDVDALKSQVAALTAALTALTTANTNE